MHICFVTRNYDAPHLGGRNPSLRYIEKELRARGHKVTIISTPFSAQTKNDDWPGNVYFTKYSLSYYTSVMLAPYRLYKAIKMKHYEDKIDVVHSCEREFAGLAAYLFRKWFKVPFLQWAYDGGYFTQRSNILQTKRGPFKYPVLLYMKHIERFVLNKANIITTIGEDISRSLVKRGFRKDKIQFIGNTVDTERFKPFKSGLRKELGLGNKKIISFVGRINKNRGTHLFIKMASIVNKVIDDCVFLVVGNDKDDFKRECVKVQEKLNVNNIIWLQPRSDIPNVLNASYCVVVPIGRFAFGTGNILLESMSTATPVVHSRASAAPYVIKNWQNGVLFNMRDYKDAAKQVIELCKNEKKAKEIGREARRTILKEHNVKSVASKLEKTYKSVADNLD